MLKVQLHGGVEAVLWLVLACLLWAKEEEQHGTTTLVSVITLAHLACRMFVLRGGRIRHYHHRDDIWRNVSNGGGGGDDAAGMFMSISLMPVLLQSMGQTAYALIVAVVLTQCWDTATTTSTERFVACGFIAAAARILQDSDPSFVSLDRLVSTKTLVFASSWLLFYKLLHASKNVMHKVVTKGEWLVVSSGMAVALAEFVCVTAVWKESLYAYTAVAGLLGCGMACAAVDLISKESVVLRLVFVVVVALGTVEGCFWYQSAATEHPLPKCLWWIIFDFLLAVETPSTGTASSRLHLPSSITEFPRMAWLAYWIVAMAATIPLAPGSNSNAVIARKWFHLVAVLLFVPATVAVPQLQSLSYAVALAVLLLLESTRHYLPWLNDFYVTYLDTSKDESQDSTIISHMALIAGCASPLWLVQWWQAAADTTFAASSSSNTVVLQLLPLWGVWTLGVGDAMGAVVGKNWGRVRWGRQQRTVEGSVAMFVGMSTVCYATLWFYGGTGGRESFYYFVHWFPAVAFVTLLEAFTLQIDNIVLPLAGVAMFMVCSMPGNW